MSDLSEMELMTLAEKDINIFCEVYGIKTEAGHKLDFRDHLFLYDIYADWSPKLVCMKAAQIGFTTCAIIKSFYGVKNFEIDAIYTMPTQSDINVFAGGKVNRIIKQNPIFQEWVHDHDTIAQKHVGKNVIYYRGCVDEETEVLTAEGWKKHGDVRIGESIPTFNMNNNSVEMDEVLDMTVFQADEDMVRIVGRSVDQLVTQDHRCVISKRKLDGTKSPLRIVRAHQLIGRQSAFVPMRFKKPDVKVDPFYRILGWVIGDGCYWTKKDKSVFVRKDGTINPKIYKSQRVCIIQSKLCDKLESDLSEANVGFYKKRHGKTCWRYELNSDFSKKVRRIIPKKRLTHKLVFSMSREQRVGMYEGLMMSDGDNVKDSSFYQNKNGTCDAFQALCVLLGRTSSLSERDSVTGKISQIVTITRSPWNNPKISVERYSGIAWCPTTKNGTIFIRRNGKVSVTGQTFIEQAAISVSSDWNIFDEEDRSNQEVIAVYASRLQHSKHRWEWHFSNPSVQGNGVSRYWSRSDQKHWFIQCDGCQKYQFLSWPDSVDRQTKQFVCKSCHKTLTDEERRVGQWRKKKMEEGMTAEFSGYWISLLMAPWVTAKEICDYYDTKPIDYFYNFVLGLPYVGEGNTVPPDVIFRNCDPDLVNDQERIVIGCDSGLKKHYVLGNKDGLFHYGVAMDWTEIEFFLKKFKRSIAVIDALPDLTEPRKLREKYPGRVFLVTYARDRSGMQLIRWGKKADEGSVLVDRNRMIQLVIDEFADQRIPLQGNLGDWEQFYSHWKTLFKITVLNSLGTPLFEWKTSDGNDHWIHACTYWRVGMDRFGQGGGIIEGVSDDGPSGIKTAPVVNPDGSIPQLKSAESLFDFEDKQHDDWRDV